MLCENVKLDFDSISIGFVRLSCAALKSCTEELATISITFFLKRRAVMIGKIRVSAARKKNHVSTFLDVVASTNDSAS